MADKKTGIAIAAAAAAAAIIPGLPRDIDVTRYTVCSSKIHTPVRMMILSDLHNADYGMNMEDLMVKVLAEKPDLILMPGDMAEEHMHQDNTLVLMKALRDFPVYYSTGNHEEYRPDLEDLLKKFRESGVQVLSYRNAVFAKGDTSLEIVGIPCRKHESDYSADDINRIYTTDNYRILLSHRPHFIDLYNHIDCQMVVSGHAHGGQWRIPGTDIGIAAPQQGLLPKYISGVHTLDHSLLVISRGLSRHYHYIPRLYNNPEIVVIDLIGREVEKQS